MPDKPEHSGLWIPKDILARTDMTYIEKVIWAIAKALPNGLRMSDATIADQVGANPRYVGNVLSKMVKSGMLKKTGSHGNRGFYPITHIGAVDPTYKCNQLHSEVESTAHICDHKTYIKNKKVYAKHNGNDNLNENVSGNVGGTGVAAYIEDEQPF